jgi:hypothetical protein
MSDTDPLLRAVADGNPAAPDGEALMRLGQLVRTHCQPPSHDRSTTMDLSDRVRARLSSPNMETDADDDRLRALIRAAATPPRSVDLTSAVRRRLTLERFLPMPSEPRRRSLRILAAVLAGHVAAALVLGMVHIDLGGSHGDAPWSASTPSADSLATLQAGSHTVQNQLPLRLPSTWATAREAGADLLLPRRLPELREDLRRRAGLADSAPDVHAGLTWLAQHAADAPPPSRALAVLAILGEGDDDATRTAATRALLATLVETDPGVNRTDPATCLALTEAAVLWQDADLRRHAENVFSRLDANALTPDNDGGFTLLALELAQQHGFALPGQTLMAARRNLARALPADESDIGRIGLAAFARFIFGLRHSPSTHHLVDLLAIQPPDIDAHPTVETWFFAALALTEEGGPTWSTWNHKLADACRRVMPVAADGQRHVAAASVTGAPDDVAATARVLIALQAPYRYLPVATE